MLGRKANSTWRKVAAKGQSGPVYAQPAINLLASTPCNLIVSLYTHQLHVLPLYMHQIHDNFLGVKSNPTIFFANSSSFEMVRSFTCSSRVKVLSVGRLGLNDHFSILPDHFIFNLLLNRYGLNDPVLTFRPFDLATF